MSTAWVTEHSGYAAKDFRQFPIRQVGQLLGERSSVRSARGAVMAKASTSPAA